MSLPLNNFRLLFKFSILFLRLHLIAGFSLSELSEKDQAIQKAYPCTSFSLNFESPQDLNQFTVRAGSFEIADGRLKATVHQSQKHKSSHLAHNMNFMYGRLLARIAAPSISGVCTAFVVN